MIHQIHSYLPDGKIYIIKSYWDNTVDKNLEYAAAFSIDIKITNNQHNPRADLKINLMRMLR